MRSGSAWAVGCRHGGNRGIEAKESPLNATCCLRGAYDSNHIFAAATVVVVVIFVTDIVIKVLHSIVRCIRNSRSVAL